MSLLMLGVLEEIATRRSPHTHTMYQYNTNYNTDGSFRGNVACKL